MLSKTFYTTVALAVASVSVAQTTTASPANLALVQAQYEAQGFAENTSVSIAVSLRLLTVSLTCSVFCFARDASRAQQYWVRRTSRREGYPRSHVLGQSCH